MIKKKSAEPSFEIATIYNFPKHLTTGTQRFLVSLNLILYITIVYNMFVFLFKIVDLSDIKIVRGTFGSWYKNQVN